MAARIAELLTQEQRVRSPKAIEACRRECSELICRLKSLREEKNPDSIWNSINRNLGVLVDAGDHNFWFRKQEQSDLNLRCDLNDLSRDELIGRLIALNDEQSKLHLLLGTEDLLEEDDMPEGLSSDLINKFLKLREQVVKGATEKKGWRAKVAAAKTRDQRLDVLCARLDSLGRETQRIAKELKKRG